MSTKNSFLCLNCQSTLDGLATDVDSSIEYEELLKRTRTNQIPVDLREKCQMQVSVAEASCDLDLCDRAISELEAQLAKLKNRRLDILQKRIALKKSLLSPIRTLPQEILLEIFLNVAQQIRFPAGTSIELAKFTSPIFGLTWVCAWWRTLILSDSRMWSSFKMHFLYVRSLSPWHVEAMDEYIGVRARTTPMQFSLEGLEYLLPHYIPPVLDNVIKSARRWKDAVFDFGRNIPAMEYLIKTLLDAGTLEYPLLESLTLRYPIFGGFSSFQHCPSLKIVNEYTGPSLTHLLMQCPSLETLSIGAFSPTPDTNSFDIEYHHTRLSHLNVVIIDASEIWKGLYLPALTHLSFRYWRHSGEGVRALSWLLNRSNCSLQEITAYYPHIKQEQWEWFIQNTSSVIRPGAVLSNTMDKL
ncbi:hypothetical protein GYMLUDRAFT_410986 [Collybiopsis luxurians FD-317 M1]|nr:hypothetical protein GYMLUDRAFT_410986 [Collybiopsis luxurians FD-317 M1]